MWHSTICYRPSSWRSLLWLKLGQYCVNPVGDFCIACNTPLTLSLLVSTSASADNLNKYFGIRSGPTECPSWSGSKPFDTLILFLQDFFEKFNFVKVSRQHQKREKLPSMQKVNPSSANHNKSRLLFSYAEMFKKPLWQTVWTQIRLLLQEQSLLGPHCFIGILDQVWYLIVSIPNLCTLTYFASIHNSSVMLGNYLKQTTSADDIFICIFFLGALRVNIFYMFVFVTV